MVGIVTGRAPPPHAPIHITSFRAVPVGCGSDVSALGATVHSSSHRTDAVVCCLKPVQKRQWRGLRACRGRVIPTDPGTFPLTPEGRRLGGGGLVLVGARAASELRVYVDRLFALAFLILTFFLIPARAVGLGSSAWYDCDTAWDFIALPPADHSAALPSYRWMAHLAKYWDGVDRSDLVPCGPMPLKVHDKAVQWCAHPYNPSPPPPSPLPTFLPLASLLRVGCRARGCNGGVVLDAGVLLMGATLNPVVLGAA